MRGRAIAIIPSLVTVWTGPSIWMGGHPCSGSVALWHFWRYGYRPDRKGD